MKDYLVYTLPLAVALFWIIRIFLLKGSNKAQLFIVAGMFIAVLSMFYRETTVLFIFPFFFLALRQKVSANGAGKWDSLVFLPSILFIPFTASPLLNIYFCIQIVVISIWAIINLHRYNRKLAELYDSSSGMSAEDIGQVLFYMISTVAVFFIVMIVGPSYDPFWFKAAIALLLTLLQYSIGRYTYNMVDTSKVAAEIAEISTEEKELKESAKKGFADEKLISRTIDEKLYLDPMLSLVSLSEKLNTNRTYLSSSIHECRGQNFSDFINNLRIEHFISLMDGESGISIKEAAFKSGYNNLQSFYRNFSEIKKKSPKDWLEQHSK